MTNTKTILRSFLAAIFVLAFLVASGPAHAQYNATRIIYVRQIPALVGYVPCVVTGSSPQTAAAATCADAYSAIQTILSTVTCASPAVFDFELGYGVGTGLSFANGSGNGCVTFRGHGLNTGLIALQGCNCSVVNNGYGYSPFGSAPTQSSNIEIDNMTINGYAGSSCGSPPCASNSSGATNTGNGTSLQCLQLYNVNGFRSKGLQLLNCPTFAGVWGNTTNDYIEDVIVNQTAGGAQNTDGLHFQAATSNVWIRNATIIGTNDDSICICAAESYGGNWSNFNVTGLFVSSAYDVIRIYTWCNGTGQGCGTTTAWSGGVATVRDVSGTVKAWIANIVGVSTTSPQTTDTSGILRFINLELSPSTGSTTQSPFNFIGKWEEVSCENCKWYSPQNAHPMFTLGKSLDNNAAISLLNLKHTGIYRTPAGNSIQSLMVQLGNTASIGKIVCEDCYVMDQPGAGPYTAVSAFLDAQSGNSVGTVELIGPMSANGLIGSLFSSGTPAQVTAVSGVENFIATPATTCGTATGNNTAGSISGTTNTSCVLTMGGAVKANNGWTGTLYDATASAFIPYTSSTATTVTFTGTITSGHTLVYTLRSY